MKKFFYLVLAVAVGFGAAKLMDRCSDDSSDNKSYDESEDTYEYCEDDSSYVIEAVDEYTAADYELLDSIIDWDMDSVYDLDYQHTAEIVEEEPVRKVIPSNLTEKVREQKNETIIKNNTEQTAKRLNYPNLKRMVDVFQSQSPVPLNELTEINSISLNNNVLNIEYVVEGHIYYSIESSNVDIFIPITFRNDTGYDENNDFINKVRKELIDNDIVVKMTFVYKGISDKKKNFTLLNSEVRKALSE